MYIKNKVKITNITNNIIDVKQIIPGKTHSFIIDVFNIWYFNRSTKSVKSTQLSIESPENIFSIEGKDFNIENFHSSLRKSEYS